LLPGLRPRPPLGSLRLPAGKLRLSRWFQVNSTSKRRGMGGKKRGRGRERKDRQEGGGDERKLKKNGKKKIKDDDE